MSKIEVIVVRLDNDKATSKPIIVMAIHCAKAGRRKKYKKFSMDRKGCIEAGEFMGRTYIGDDEVEIRFSSSVDFPCEVKRRSRLDVRGIMQSAFEKIVRADDDVANGLKRKILTHCNTPEFISRLSDLEKVKHRKICAEYGIRSLHQ